MTGRDELVHRVLKEFAGEEVLPFKRFAQNATDHTLLLVCLREFQGGCVRPGGREGVLPDHPQKEGDRHSSRGGLACWSDHLENS